MPKPTNESADDAKAAPESEAPEGAENAEKKAPKSFVRTMLTVLAVLLVPASVGGFVAYTQFGSIAEAAVASGMTFGFMHEADSTESMSYGQFVTLDELLVNPKDSEGKRFLIVSLGLETKSPVVFDELERKDVVVRDAILSLLSEHTAAELGSIEQRDTLKVQILDTLNMVLQEGEIQRLYFTQYLLQ